MAGAAWAGVSGAVFTRPSFVLGLLHGAWRQMKARNAAGAIKVGFHILRGHKAHRMPQRLQLARPTRSIAFGINDVANNVVDMWNGPAEQQDYRPLRWTVKRQMPDLTLALCDRSVSRLADVSINTVSKAAR